MGHNGCDARSRNTHASIARALLDKREQIGADSSPTIIVGDMNPFASSGASEGSLESTLIAAGFRKAYQARGNPGHGGLDKIFVSSHWQATNGVDRGTGGSVHPAITADVALI